MKKRVAIRVLLAAMLVAVTLPFASAPAAEVGSEQFQFKRVSFRTTWKPGRFMYLDIFAFDSRHGGYGSPDTLETEHAVTPVSKVFACMVVQIKTFVDYACGYQATSALTMSTDMSSATVNFKGVGKMTRRTMKGYFTVTGIGSATHVPAAGYELPEEIAEDGAQLNAVVLSARAARASGRATVSRAGTLSISGQSTKMDEIRAASLSAGA